MIKLILGLIDRLNAMPAWINGLLCRLAVATTFWRSGQTKVHGFFVINDQTYDLFRDEYRVPLVPPDLAAIMATVNEHVCSVLLVIGLASRMSALVLFGMTMVIQIFVYPESWPDHILWCASLIYVILRGPGAISADHLLRAKFNP